MKNKILFSLIFISSLSNAQPDCNQVNVGYTPINDLGVGTWNSFVGGLYPNGSNFIPSAHKNTGLLLANQIQPLDANGNPDAVNGKIVFLSVGMSNCTQEFSAFMPLTTADPNKNPKIVLVDGAQGGQTAQIISNPTAGFWNTIDIRLQTSNVTAKQVQAIWYKEANQAGSLPLGQTYTDSLLAQSKRIMNIIKTRYPNAKICYVASRIYGGYASTNLNPEPYAYLSGWAKKWLIEAQINGDPMLQHSGTNPNSPWLAWGTYNWADGTTPRSDGLTWICPIDFQNDGTHPSNAGAGKVATALLTFLDNDSTACWYRTGGCASILGTSEIEKSSVSIFPNPASEEIIISATDLKENAKIYLEDIYGKNIYLGNYSFALGQKINIDCSQIKPGIYFMKFDSGSSSFTKKVVVLR